MNVDISPTLTVAHTPWFLCALLLTLRVMGTGLAWSWLIPARGRLTPTAIAALMGVTINALIAMVLAEAGVYTPGLEAMALLLVAGVGLVAGRRHLPWRQLFPGTLCMLGVFSLVMALPHRGEWIGGGWDPGIYVCQGVSVALGGDATPGPDALLQSLTAAELDAFTRSVHNYTEYLPVTPVDPATRRIEPFFFRLTPSWIAVLFRCGGLRAATRVNLFTAVPVLLLFGALVWSWKPALSHLAPALTVLLLHPIWLFMLNFPTTEMLQLMLVLGLLLVWPQSTWIPALLLFAALTNRFSFLPFAGLLLCACAWTGSPRDSRGVRLVWIVACVAGVAYDYLFCGITIGRLDELVPPLLIAGGVLLGTSLFIGDRLRNLLSARRLAGLLLLAAVGMLAMDLVTGAPHVAMRRNLGGALPYLGPLLLLAALTGWIPVRHGPRPQQGALLFLAGATLASFTVAAIAPLYPWALRRHLVYTLPLVAALAAAAFTRAWDHKTRPRYRAALMALAVLLIGSNLPRGMHALSRTEFNGLSATLARVAGQLRPGDVVVADHFRWGTPLKWLHGVQVLNGEVLWQDETAERTAAALEALQRLHDGGRRIVLFTSTADGTSVFPGDWGRPNQIWSSGPRRLRELNHHAKTTGFPQLAKTKVFALYVWEGTNPPIPKGPPTPE